MLQNLHVKNLALIEEIDIDLTDGLLVLTGETGAGKSLILGSVNIALGEKASKDLIRPGSDYCLVELTFLLDDKCRKKIQDLDIYIDDDDILVVTRRISDARNISKINGETVTVKTLKKVMELLVDVHGQHDHQSLLYTQNHAAILDKFAKDDIDDDLKELDVEYSRQMELKSELEKYDMDDAMRVKEMDFTQYEINEIDSANLKIGEDEELEGEYKKISNGGKIADSLNRVYQLLDDDAGVGVSDLIEKAELEISHISNFDEKTESMSHILYDMEEMCGELSSQILDYRREMEFDPDRAKTVEERLDVINHLKLKYGRTIEDILKYRDERSEYLESLKNYEAEKSEINDKISKSYEAMDKISQKLSSARTKAAKELEVLVTDALLDLNFLTVDFRINIERMDDITKRGFDRVEFLISTNPGQPPRPMSKVASGGELSRIMLGLKSILASEDEIGTLIFDEIDTGISGQTALKVAKKLAKISKNHQVICISHLPQIAAMADSHYLIEKVVEDGGTKTGIRKLDHEQSVEELVRIGGSGEITKAAKTHAEEMIDSACRQKREII